MAKKVHKRKKITLRTCIGCGESKPKRELLRIVRTPEKKVVIDKSGKMNGRGTYVCYRKECIESAVKKNKISYALEVALEQDEIGRIQQDVLQTIEEVIEVS